MESHERQSAKDRLALLQLLMTGHERRHEVVDAVWDARDEDEAAERLRGLLGATADPRVILDMPLGRLAAEERKRLAGAADELRRLLGQE
jgi:DNA gyrase/topoisomerase IV subunit A